MKKYIDMADYWTVDKILDYVETYYQLVEKEKKAPSRRELQRWLDLDYTKKKYQGVIRKIKIKGNLNGFNVHDVKEMLSLDKDVYIDDVDTYLNSSNDSYNYDVKNIFKDYGNGFISDYLTKYGQDNVFRERVDATISEIKTGILINLSISTKPKDQLSIDNDKVLASAIQHVTRHVNFGWSNDDNDKRILEGDLDFYTK